jgi:hypothetical protein
MNWYTLLELLGFIALTELAYLPLTIYLWRDRETNGCETFHATALPEYRVHLDQTQAVNPSPSRTAGRLTYFSTGLRMFTKRAIWHGRRSMR